MTRLAYLDVNATAPVPPEVRAAVLDALALEGNPSAVHRAGRAARRLVEDARETLATFVDAAPSSVVFTSGGTEANALAIQGLAATGALARVIVSAIEHSSVLAAARRTGLPVLELPVDASGVVLVDALGPLLSAGALVCVMAANNETGVMQPVAEIAARARVAGAFVHVDAVQALGRGSLSLADLGADSVALSAHKIGGPKGVGALVTRPGLAREALWSGGGQERGARAGTENVPGIAGFAAALTYVASHRTELARVERLRDGLEREALARVADARVFGAGAPRLPNTSALALPGLAAEVQVMALDLEGIAVSAGAACSSGKVARSHVLDAMGAGALAGETIRVSLGFDNDDSDVARFLEVWGALAARRVRGDRERVSA